MKDEKSEAELEQFIQKLELVSGMEREKIRKELVRSGEKTIPHFLKLLNHKKPFLRWEAMKGLSEISSHSLIPVFLEYIESEERDLSWLAEEGLINIGSRSVIPVLELLMEKADSVFVLSSAHHIFFELFRENQLPEDSPVKTLLPLLNKTGKKEVIEVAVFKVLNELKHGK